MSNPSGDSTILGLPLAAPLNGSEVIPMDQKQGDLYYTVRVPVNQFASQGVVGVSYGTTAQRPITPVPGQPYFDTTRGFRIDWNPILTQWVDAAGVPV